MFSDMLHCLQSGRRPDEEALRRRLDAAVIKKGGILQQPKACWSGDTKINPDAVHMFWAAVILVDRDALVTVAGMIGVELSFGALKVDYNHFLQRKLVELGQMAVDPETVGWLEEKISTAASVLESRK